MFGKWINVWSFLYHFQLKITIPVRKKLYYSWYVLILQILSITSFEDYIHQLRNDRWGLLPQVILSYFNLQRTTHPTNWN